MAQIDEKLKELSSHHEYVIKPLIASLDALDDDDKFEIDFQVEKCLKAMKSLKRIADKCPIMDTVDHDVAQFKQLDSTHSKKIPCDEKNNNKQLVKVEVDIDGDEQAMNSGICNDVASKEPKPEDLNDDVLAAFLDDDDDEDWMNEPNVDDEKTLEVDSRDNLKQNDENVNEDYGEPVVEELVDPPTDKHRHVLKQHFGHKTFRPFQWTIISGALNERIDQCVIMATGYGKSLCYQYPSVYTGRTTVVVSPLISLMTDQVLSLNLVNIPATYLGSAQEKTSEVVRNLLSGKYRIVYVTPEFVTGDGGEELLERLNKKVGIDLIAIDEAHCVSQWGHDFRGSYQQMGCLKKKMPGVPILAVTATATPAVREDICRSLRLVKPRLTCTSFDRQNLRFCVQRKVDVYSDLRSQMTVNSSGKYCFDGPTIIYCPTKKSTEEVTDVVRGMGISVARYHAGLSMSERKQAHENFVADKVQAIVATVAFGMGIDKPDVRLIIHYGAPKDLESYYQETGRAGRDGSASACIAFYATKDFNVNRMILSDIQNPKFLEHKTEMLQKMQSYLASTQCRRRMILRHFDSLATSPLYGTADCCDNCETKLEKKDHDAGRDDVDDGTMKFGELFDFGEDASILFDSIVVFNQRYGLGAAVALIIGSSDKRAQAHRSSRVYAAGKHHTQKWWMTLGRLLLSAGYLAEDRVPNSFGTTVRFTRKGESWYGDRKSNPELKLEPNHDMLALQKTAKKSAVAPVHDTAILPSVPCNTWLSSKQLAQFSAPSRQFEDGPEEKEIQAKLYAELMNCRNDVAEEQGVAPYMVASNKNLLELAKFRPCDMANLTKIEDLPEVKQQKFGQKIVDRIAKFCSENDAKRNRFQSESPSPSSTSVAVVDEDLLMELPETARASYSLLEREGKTVEEVCRMRNIKPSTVVGHVACAIKHGIPVDIEKFGVTDKVQKLILDTIRAPPINSDISKRTPIKEVLPDSITWDQLNIVLAILERKFGISGVSAATGDTAGARYEPKSSQSADSQDGKRKLPNWMGNAAKTAPAVKKQKSNLFRR